MSKAGIRRPDRSEELLRRKKSKSIVLKTGLPKIDELLEKIPGFDLSALGEFSL